MDNRKVSLMGIEAGVITGEIYRESIIVLTAVSVGKSVVFSACLWDPNTNGSMYQREVADASGLVMTFSSAGAAMVALAGVLQVYGNEAVENKGGVYKVTIKTSDKWLKKIPVDVAAAAARRLVSIDAYLSKNAAKRVALGLQLAAMTGWGSGDFGVARKARFDEVTGQVEALVEDSGIVTAYRASLV